MFNVIVLHARNIVSNLMVSAHILYDTVSWDLNRTHTLCKTIQGVQRDNVSLIPCQPEEGSLYMSRKKFR
jgi:hypothetical protein